MERTRTNLGSIALSTTLTRGPNRQIVAKVREHEFRMDVRKERGGDDIAPTPLEYMAAALGGCVMNLIHIIAAENEIVLGKIGVTVSGDIDPSRAFGLETEERAGFSELTVTVEINTDAPEKEEKKLYRQLLKRCPLCDTISNPTPVKILFNPC